jgi:hypothetical protein
LRSAALRSGSYFQVSKAAPLAVATSPQQLSERLKPLELEPPDLQTPIYEALEKGLRVPASNVQFLHPPICKRQNRGAQHHPKLLRAAIHATRWRFCTGDTGAR